MTDYDPFHMHKISVVIPSFNQGNYIGEAIESVLNQHYSSLELIVVDGGSTDHTLEILRKYDDRITFWVSEKDKGQSDAINKGFAHCTGDIVAWLCSDDRYEEGAFDKVIRLFDTLPDDAGLIHGDVLVFDTKGIIEKDTGYPEVTAERILSGMAFSQPSVFFRKSLLDKSGWLNESLHYGMDYDLFARMSVFSRFVYLPEVLSHYRLHPTSKTMSATSGFIKDWLAVFGSIVEGLQLKQASEALRKVNPELVLLPPLVEFFRRNNYPYSVHQERLCYCMLTNVLRFNYNGGLFSKAHLAGRILLKEYAEMLQQDPAVFKIAKRSQWPGMFIRLMRRLNSIRRGR
jgi:glycosyltransferase involved in cell wall biosynthesis